MRVLSNGKSVYSLAAVAKQDGDQFSTASVKLIVLPP